MLQTNLHTRPQRVADFQNLQALSLAQCLVCAQLAVMREAGERYLLVPGQVEAELALAEVRAGLGPVIQSGPTVALLDLVDDLRGADAYLQRAQTFLVRLMRNDDLIRFLSMPNDCAVEI